MVVGTDESKQMLRMKEGMSDTSYAKCSFMQKQVLSMTRIIKEEAMREFHAKQRPTTLCIADLGCSSAEQNTMCVVSELIDIVEKIRAELGHHGLVLQGQDYQVYLNDLPGNDFNTLFRSVTSFRDNLKENGCGNCFVNGVPGSFYERLFPDNSLHFVHSSYSLPWLSSLPEGLDDNTGNIFIARTSPPQVLKAYYEQFQKDFLTFLHCRSKEVVNAGKMVLTLPGRDNDEPFSEEYCYVWEMLATALSDMISEGCLEEEKVKTFNIPNYLASPMELELLVKKQGCFTLNKVYFSRISWNDVSSSSHDDCQNDPSNDFVKCIRSVAEPLLISHFGEAIVIEKVFQKFADNVRALMAQEEKRSKFVTNVTLSLTRNVG